MLVLLLPALLLPAGVSVLASAAGDAANERSTAPEIGPGYLYVFPVIFAFIVLASMAANAILLLWLWPGYPSRSVPVDIAAPQSVIYATLVLWGAHLWLEWRDMPSSLGFIVLLSPLVLVGLSLLVFLRIVLSRSTVPRVSTQRAPGFTIAASSFLAIVAVSLVLRFTLALDATGQNALNLMLVVLGLPFSLVVAPIGWIFVNIAARSEGAFVQSTAVALTIALPAVLNSAVVTLTLVSERFRTRWVPPIALM